MDKDGRFDLRFPEIINSPINDKWYNQLVIFFNKMTDFNIMNSHGLILKD